MSFLRRLFESPEERAARVLKDPDASYTAQEQAIKQLIARPGDAAIDALCDAARGPAHSMLSLAALAIIVRLKNLRFLKSGSSNLNSLSASDSIPSTHLALHVVTRRPRGLKTRSLLRLQSTQPAFGARRIPELEGKTIEGASVCPRTGVKWNLISRAGPNKLLQRTGISEPLIDNCR